MNIIKSFLDGFSFRLGAFSTPLEFDFGFGFNPSYWDEEDQEFVTWGIRILFGSFCLYIEGKE